MKSKPKNTKKRSASAEPANGSILLPIRTRLIPDAYELTYDEAKRVALLVVYRAQTDELFREWLLLEVNRVREQERSRRYYARLNAIARRALKNPPPA